MKIGSIEEYRGDVIAEELAKYFSTIGKQYAQKIGPSATSKHDYLNMIPINRHSIFLSPVTKWEIDRLLMNLMPKNSSGIDNISNRLLKELKPSLLGPLEIIFNNSLRKGVFPEKMKIAKVVPLYKGKCRSQSANYRPISLLLTLSKILEKIMYK